MSKQLSFQNLKKTFKSKKVFITGHTGFKGSWLSMLLAELGADVMGFALPPDSELNNFNLLQLKDIIHHYEGDIRDADLLKKRLNEFKPEFVFHLAAQALVRPSYSDPSLTFSTNIMGSVNLLEAIRECESVRSLVFITSDKCYENVEWIWGYRENDRLGGRDPYSASKAGAEIVFSSYYHSFFKQRAELGCATARAGNVIGGGDWAPDRIVPDCIRAISLDEPIYLRNPLSTRPWQHVLEPLSGYLELAARVYQSPEGSGDSWNFGPAADEVLTVEVVAKSMVQYMGKGSVIRLDHPNSSHEANLLQLNCDKANQLMGWRAKWCAKRAIEETANWYKRVMDGESPRDITNAQISSYFSEKK